MKQSYKFAKRLWQWFKQWFKRYWVAILSGVIVSAIASWSLLSMQKDPNLAAATVATATLLMVWGTAISIDINRRIAKRNRDERLLNEVIDWAIGISRCNHDLDKIILSERLDNPPFRTVGLERLQTSFQDMWERGKYVIEVTRTFRRPLYNAVKDAIKEVGNLINILGSAMIEIGINTEYTTIGDVVNLDDLENRRVQLTKSINITIKKASQIKLGLL